MQFVIIQTSWFLITQRIVLQKARELDLYYPVGGSILNTELVYDYIQ
jgi:hypothetical protein